MPTKNKRPQGRPRKDVSEAVMDSPVIQEVSTPTKPRIKRVETKTSAKEYKAVSSGAVLMLMQSGITVFDEDTKMVREVRYCQNEHSIFKDEQNERSVKTPIIFRMGRLFVKDDQPNLQAFLDAHPENRANGGNTFYVVDKKKSVEKDLDKDFLVNDAISMLRSKSMDELLAVAIAYGMDINRSSSEIKHDLLQKAKKSPKQFINSFDNPVVLMKAKIRQAISFQIIKADKTGIKWFDTNKLIISVPAGQDPVDVFVRYCMTEAAAPVVAEIERQLD